MKRNWPPIFSALLSRISFAVIVGGLIDLLLIFAQTPLRSVWVAGSIAGAAIVTLAGETILLLFGIDRLVAWLPAALVVGASVTGVVMLAPTLLLEWTAQSAFVAWSLLVLIGSGLLHRRWRQAPVAPWRDCLVAGAWAVVVAFFCRDIAAALPTVITAQTLPAWTDFYTHASTIASFGSPGTIGLRDILLPGMPRVLYHYGSFLIPAALSQITDLPGLGLATAVHLPLGLFLGLCGLFALAAELAGTGLAFVALGLAVFLPDPSHYGLRNGFLGATWLVFSISGSGHAIGGAALAYLATVRWLRSRRWSSLMLAGLLTALLVMLRVQMFMLIAPALAGVVVVELLPPRWRRAALAMAGLLAVTLTVLLLFGGLGGQLLGLTSPKLYLIPVYSMGPASIIATLRTLGEHWDVLAGWLLLLPATLGFWLVALAAALARGIRDRRHDPADLIPVLLCASYLLLAVWAPTAFNQDVTEYKHRHFVLLYYLIAVWAALRLLEGTPLAARLCRLRPAAALPAMVFTGLVIFAAYRHTDPARPSPLIGQLGALYDSTVSPGIPGIAAYLRQHAAADDIVLVGGRGANNSTRGPAMELVSLSDRPSYVTRTDLMLRIRPPAITAVIQQRMADQAAIDHAPDRDSAMARLRRCGIRWYVMASPDRPDWDRYGDSATFRAGGALIYQVDDR